MNLLSLSSKHTIKIGTMLGTFLQQGDVLALEGTLASGKTTFTKGIAQSLNIEEPITSPTFTLISEYYGKHTLYHMDVYRLDSVEDFLNLGVEEMLYGTGICIIEWSDKVKEALPPSTIHITLEIPENTDHRIITIKNWPYGEIVI